MDESEPVAWVAFEDEVFKRIDRWLKRGSFIVSPERATAYRKRSYYSEPRKADIEFEVVIEALDKGATEPSLVWVFECKDNTKSGRPVEVSDVEILNSKIDQLGRSKFRASLVTTHGFQSGALELAKSSGISLFVLKKKLQRISCYSEDAVDYIDESIVVTDGATGAGRAMFNDVWLEMALLHCYREFFESQSA